MEHTTPTAFYQVPMFHEYITGKVCQYCDQKTELLLSSKEIYMVDYGPVYICRRCKAYVGCHKSGENKGQSLGVVANKELRQWKMQAHKFFDALWQHKMKSGIKKHEARKMAYQWVSEKLDIPPSYTHIGMFDIKTCKALIALCGPYYNKIT
jgi:hypothetical protein